MSLKGGGKPGSGKGKNSYEVSSPTAEQLSQGVVGITLDGAQDGDWEVIARKAKTRAGNSAAKPSISQNSNLRPWGQADTAQKVGLWNNAGSGRMSSNTWTTQAVDKRPAGRGNSRPQPSNRVSENNYLAPQSVIPPPLENGWNWRQSSAGSTAKKGLEEALAKDESAELNKQNTDDEEDEDGGMDDMDDDLLSEDFDSDESQKSHETRKKNRWFKIFFEKLESLTVEEINEPDRQWHCPACQRGPGAIDWFRGLQPLVTHAKTKGSKRVRLHRELAELLEEELHRRGTSVIPAGEAFGKWQGLKGEEKDREIVWPPMVIVMNTKLEQDDNDKWIGMGNQELLDYFSGYAAVRARHSYGPQGHRGISVLIFESSAVGYLEAERLHKHFADEGTDREAWDRRRRVLFHHGGKRQLYGYMAMKEDLDSFNQHSQGKTRLKFDLRSYNEMVVRHLNQMSEDNQKLTWLETRVAREQRQNKTLTESLEIVTDKLRKTTEENRIVRQRTQMHHEQSQEELDFQEQFFKDQLRIVHEARNAKEEDFENLQQKEREKAQQLGANPSNAEEYKRRVQEAEKFIKFQEKEIEGYVEERDALIKSHEEKFAAMKKRHWEEEIELEKQLGAELTSLMHKYTTHCSEGPSE